jgi:uncharacterized protein YbjT (DUF2867 family)
MTRPPILVVGATGNVGTDVVRHLLDGGHRVRVLVRDAGKAADLFGDTVEIVVGDLDVAASLEPAVRGIEVAAFTTAPTPLLGEQEVAFITAAAAAGVHRLVKLSGFGIGDARDAIHIGHARSEDELRRSGIPHVVIRPVVFMSNLMFEAPAVRTGKLPSVFGDAPMSFVDPADVAELMVRALSEDAFDGQVWELGGPEPLSYDQLAEVFSDVLGRPVAHVRVDPEEFRESSRREGLPDFVIEAITDTGRMAGEGKFVADDAVIRRILGRPGAPFRDWIARNRDAFQPADVPAA